MKVKPKIESFAKDLSWLEVGNTYYNLGNYLGAVKTYEKAIQGGEKNPIIYFNIANAYLNCGDFMNARSNFYHYLTICPEDNEALKILAYFIL